MVVGGVVFFPRTLHPTAPTYLTGFNASLDDPTQPYRVVIADLASQDKPLSPTRVIAKWIASPPPPAPADESYQGIYLGMQDARLVAWYS